RPAHLSHYQLTIEQGTVFAGNPPCLPEDDTAAEMLEACRSRLNEHGFSQYEVSAYALAGRRCRHNLNYWTFGDYLGIGAGAHGKLTLADTGSLTERSTGADSSRGANANTGADASAGADASRGGGRRAQDAPLIIVRTQQTRDPRRFIANPTGQLARRAVTPADLPFEFMLNALRLVEGFERGLFRERTGLAVPQRRAAQLSWEKHENDRQFWIVNGSLTATLQLPQRLYTQAPGPWSSNEWITRQSGHVARCQAYKPLKSQREIPWSFFDQGNKYAI